MIESSFLELNEKFEIGTELNGNWTEKLAKSSVPFFNETAKRIWKIWWKILRFFKFSDLSKEILLLEIMLRPKILRNWFQARILRLSYPLQRRNWTWSSSFSKNQELNVIEFLIFTKGTELDRVPFFRGTVNTLVTWQSGHESN